MQFAKIKCIFVGNVTEGYDPIGSINKSNNSGGMNHKRILDLFRWVREVNDIKQWNYK